MDRSAPKDVLLFSSELRRAGRPACRRDALRRPLRPLVGVAVAEAHVEVHVVRLVGRLGLLGRAVARSESGLPGGPEVLHACEERRVEGRLREVCRGGSEEVLLVDRSPGHLREVVAHDVAVAVFEAPQRLLQLVLQLSAVGVGGEARAEVALLFGRQLLLLPLLRPTLDAAELPAASACELARRFPLVALLVLRGLYGLLSADRGFVVGCPETGQERLLRIL